MIVLTIFLLVALVIVAWRRQQSPTPVLNLLLVGLAVASLAAAAMVWCRPHLEEARCTARTNRLQEAIGFELGQAVAQAFPQGGTVLVLLAGLPAKFPKNGVGAAQVKGLQAGFGRANLQAVPVGYTPATDFEAMEIQAEWPRRGVPFEKINEWFAAHRDAVAVVAFLLVGTGPRGQPPPQIPPLFVVGAPAIGMGPETKELGLDWVRPGAVEAVVVYRGFDWESVAATGSLPDVFRTCCELVTPANVAAVRSRSTGGRQ